jgi:hypothetical protein
VVVHDHHAPPSRSEVAAVWRQLIAGVRSRQQVHDWAVPWVEHRWAQVVDPPTMSALERLHGFDMTYDKGRPNVVRHGPGDHYVHSSEVITDRLDRSPESCRHYDANPNSAWYV